MERRPYFVLGDLFVNAIAGVAALLSARALIAPSWHALVAMPLGMGVGALSASMVAFLFMPLFGAFEVMLPAMLTGMIAGMTASMLEAPALTGALIGLAVVGWIYLLTAVAARSRDGLSSRA
jgi:hypothetical protein